jgi:HAD superfamily hydrolase (TIGR01490 family)
MRDQELALFDFNGTITKEQILVDFVKFSVHPVRIITGVLFLWPVLLLYMKRRIANKTAKEVCFTWFFRGENAEELKEKGEAFSKEKLSRLIIPGALEKLRWHVAKGHTVAVVSGSIDFLLIPWCKREHVHLIANRMEIKKGKITGRISSDNCWGKGKVALIKKEFNLKQYQKIHAYGNTDGDFAMLDLADYRNFNRFN